MNVASGPYGEISIINNTNILTEWFVFFLGQLDLCFCFPSPNLLPNLLHHPVSYAIFSPNFFFRKLRLRIDFDYTKRVQPSCCHSRRSPAYSVPHKPFLTGLVSLDNNYGNQSYKVVTADGPFKLSKLTGLVTDRVVFSSLIYYRSRIFLATIYLFF